MKMIFVDAENIGIKELEKINATVIDKVFVFSKVGSIQRICEKSLFLFLSDYPTGANQADFYIIAYLSRVLSVLDKKQFSAVNFELYSNDENLISAFKFQCEQLGANAQIIRTKSNKNNVGIPTVSPTVAKTPAVKPNTTPQDKLFSALKSPKSLSPELQKHLGLSKSDFTRAITGLIQAKKIQRSAESKKWIRC